MREREREREREDFHDRQLDEGSQMLLLGLMASLVWEEFTSKLFLVVVTSQLDNLHVCVYSHLNISMRVKYNGQTVQPAGRT